MSSIVRLSSWKENGAHLADHAGDQLVRGLRERMALGPRGRTFGALLDPEEAVGVQPQRAGPEIGQCVQRVADHQPHPRERWVEPVDRRLAVLEVVQVDPAALDPVHALHGPRRTPVRLLDAALVEDHALQAADDVAGVLEIVLGLRRQVDRIRPAGTSGSRCQSSRGIETMW